LLISQVDAFARNGGVINNGIFTLVASYEAVNKTGDYLIVQITSKLNNDYPSIHIDDTNCLQPLPLKSYIRTHKIFTVHKNHILSKITAVKPVFLKTVTDMICSLIK
jgi:mRNA interferase MazF